MYIKTLLSSFQLIANKLFFFFFLNSISKMYKQMINNNNKYNKVVSHSKKNPKEYHLKTQLK